MSTSYQKFSQKYKGVKVASIISDRPDLAKLAIKLKKKPTWKFLVSWLYKEHVDEDRRGDEDRAAYLKHIDDYIDEVVEDEIRGELLGILNEYKEVAKFDNLQQLHKHTIHFLDDEDESAITDKKLAAFASAFRDICNSTKQSARIVFVCYDDNGNPFPFRLNDENIEFVYLLLLNRGSYTKEVKKKHGSDIEWMSEEFVMSKMIILDIDQLSESEKTHYLGKNYGGYFPYILNCCNHSLSRYQIYNLVESATNENCFVYALRMSGAVDDITLANIKHDVGDIPFITKAGVKFIANKYNLHITVVTGYDRGRSYDVYGNPVGSATMVDDVSAQEIKLGLYENHYFILDKDVEFNVLYFKYRNCAECAGVSDERMWYTNGYNRNGPRFKTSIKVKDSLQLFRDLFKYPNILIPVTNRNAPKVVAADDEIVFDVQDANFRRYMSDSSNIVSEFYRSIPNLYQIGGNLESAMRKCIYGGRVLISKPKLHVKDRVTVLDVNSLYPAAMKRLFIQTGVAKVLPTLTLDEILSHLFIDGQISKTSERFISSAIVKINITHIAVEHKYPVINNLSVGTYWVDAIILEDLVKYHHISADVIGGFYYDGDRDYSIRDFIQKLYDKRKENPEYKLIMNKIYGYSIRRNKQRKIKTVDTEAEMMNYICKHYHTFHRAQKNENGKFDIIVDKKWTSAYNMANFGVSILSMSKRIMNEILYTCEDNDIDVFYSDTDSIFIKYSDVDKLNSLFNNNLIGDKLGQMKVDFDYDYPYATEAIFLSKKRYICKLDDEHYHYRYIGMNKDKIREPWKFYMSQLHLCE